MNSFIRYSINSPDQENQRDFYKEYLNLVKVYEFIRFFGALLGNIAIIPAIVSYEESFSESRTIDKCSINSINATPYRIMIFILSYSAVILELLYKYFYYKSLKIYPLTFQERPPPRPLSYLDIIEMTRPRSLVEYVFDRKSYLVILLYVIFPYPYIDIQVNFYMKSNYEDMQMCYYLEEIALFVMLFRVFYLVATSLSFGFLRTPVAVKECEKYGVRASATFAFKVYIYLYPIQVVGFLLFVPGLVILGYGFKIFESPLHLLDINNMENSIWLSLITMLTIGYGDLYPKSIFGRIISILSIVWGGVVLSIVFSTMRDSLSFTPQEKTAYLDITTSKESGKLVKSFHIFVDNKIKNKKSVREEKSKIITKILKKVSGETAEEAQIRAFNSLVFEINNNLGQVRKIDSNLRVIKSFVSRLPKKTMIHGNHHN